jgi:hypothetical protein
MSKQLPVECLRRCEIGTEWLFHNDPPPSRALLEAGLEQVVTYRAEIFRCRRKVKQDIAIGFVFRVEPGESYAEFLVVFGILEVTGEVVDVLCKCGPAGLVEFPARVKTPDALLVAADERLVLFVLMGFMAIPRIANRSANNPSQARLNSAGISSRLHMSPVAPNTTTVQGSVGGVVLPVSTLTDPNTRPPCVIDLLRTHMSISS